MTIVHLPPMPALVLNTKGKPPIPDWIPPPETKEDLPWATLHTLDLSMLDSPDPAVVDELQATCKRAIEQDGFLYVKNFGVTHEQLLRQFALAQFCLVGEGMADSERERLTWKPETGSFAGYKPRIGWGEKGKGAKDQIEHFNYYEAAFKDTSRVPENMRPYLDEIKAYAWHIHNEVNRRLFLLLSRILELPDEYLWNNCQSHGEILGNSYYRHQVYHPFDKEEAKTASLVMHGHTDYGTTTILASQPITCLQMLSNDGVWRYVKYEPERLLVNLGDALEVASGGHFKATRHKVVKPPVDQMDYIRVALINFNTAPQDMVMTAIPEAPVIEREGTKEDSEVYGAFMDRIRGGHQIPTFGEWRTIRSQNAQAPPEKIVERNGRKFKEQLFNGVKVHMPI